MSDPLSIAGSVVGIIALADVAFKYVYKYVRAAKNAESDIKALADEIDGLARLLRHLEALASDLEDEGDKFDPALRAHYLSHCEMTLQQIEKRVKKAANSFAQSKLQGFARQLKWPYSASETKGLLTELSRHKATITAALATDSMRKLQLSLSKISELDKQLAAIGQTVAQIEVNTRIDMNDQRRRVLDFFMKVSPQPNLETSIKLRHPMTGTWLTESPRFLHWLETPGSKLWLTGIPGAGKTVLAGSVIQEALNRSYNNQQVGVAFFFCDYKSSKTWETVVILGAIASQLARQKDEAFEILRQYHDDLHPKKGLAHAPDPDELRARIVQMSELFDQTMIVVDGLDECSDKADDVVDILLEVADYAQNLSMALLSRDHLNIRDRLEPDFDIAPIAADTSDLKRYVSTELEQRIKGGRLRLSDMSVKEEIAEALVSRAQGMFRWVVCQLDYLCDCLHDAERREALKKLPPDLPESYRRLLERVNRSKTGAPAMVQMCLHFIAHTDLTITQLRQAVSTPTTLGATLYEKNMISEQEISWRCSSLVRKSADGERFEFAHFSVQEFLEDEEALSQPPNTPGLRIDNFFITKEKSRSLLAAQCLRFLQLRNFEQSPTSSGKEMELTWVPDDEQYSFYKYSAMEWIRLTKEGFDDTTLALATSLFHPKRKAQFLHWATTVLIYTGYETSRVMDVETKEEGDQSAAARWVNRHSSGHFLRVRQTVLDNSFKPLHMAALLNLPEICRYLLDQGAQVNCRWGTERPIDLAFVTVSQVPGCIFDTSSVGDDHARLYSTRSTLLPNNKRRSLTINCLIEHGAELSNNRVSEGSLSLFSITCTLGSWSGDFSLVLELLHCGITPGTTETEWFSFCTTSSRMTVNNDTESSTLAILQYLTSTSVYDTEWGRQMGSTIWHLAVKHGFSYTEDPFLVDSGISMSEETLTDKMLTAIKHDDVKSVKRYLADDRLDQGASFSEHGDTLLHIAVQHIGSKTLKALLDAGCDPYLQNAKGDLPIHMYDWSYQDYEIFGTLKAFGVSLSSQNSQGLTIWHLWAEQVDRAKFPSEIFKLDPEEACCALKMKSYRGDTALSLLLWNPCCSNQEVGHALQLVDHCSEIPGYWQTHGPAFSAAAHFGSEMVIRRLQEAGATAETAVEGSRTPLHHLGLAASLQAVRVLLDLYEEALQYRFEGELPVEAYIMTCLGVEVKPDADIIGALAPPSLISSQKSLWTFACHLPGRTLQQEMPWHEVKSHMLLVNGITADMLRLGAMRVYEDSMQKSGLLPLFLGIIWGSLVFELIFCGSTDHIRDALSQTSYLAEAINSSAALELFAGGIYCLNLDLTRLFLNYQIDIHGRFLHGLSPISFVCWSDTAIRLSSSEDGKVILQELLNHCVEEKLNQVLPAYNILGPLHTLATSEDATSILWWVEALIERGANINLMTGGCRRISVLAHHLYKSSTQCAELLLKLGADPMAKGSPSSPTAVQAAIETGNTAFLKLLLVQTYSGSLEIDWEMPMDINKEWKDTKVLRTREATALHCAAMAHDSGCLEFLFGENLISTDVSKSSEGLTPLHVSAFAGSVETTKLLLSRGFNVMAGTNRRETPLHFATKGGSLSVLKLLVQHGASQTMNIHGKTPVQYAHGEDFLEMVSLLNGISTDDKSQLPFEPKDDLPSKQLQIFADALQNAVRAGEKFECERLFGQGCPVDVSLHKSNASSALVLALQLKKLEMAEWLLSKGASVLKTWDNTLDTYSVIEVVTAYPSLNPLLPQIVERYFAQGGDLVSGDDFPLHRGADNGNTEGLEILLQYLEACSSTLERKYRMRFHQIKHIILNRLHQQDNWGLSAVHVASNLGNKSMVSFLVEEGSSIDRADVGGWTPLVCAKTADMAQHLISLGASTSSLFRRGHSDSLRYLTVKQFVDLYPLIISQLPKGLLINSPPVLGPAPQFNLRIDPKDILKLDEMKYPLLLEDESGRNLMHYIICRSHMSDVVLDADLGLPKTTPFPWHLELRHFSRLAFLTTKFRKFQQKLSHEAFRKILNLEPSRGWSPLCRAASLDFPDIISNCLEMGAQIDFEGCPFGSAVMVASVCGSIDAVKFLVRKGASVFYTGPNGSRNCYALAGSPAIKSWLLSGRFMDQLSITAPGENDEGIQIKPWSGPVRAGVRLYGRREKSPTASMLDDAERLGLARKHWESKVVPFDEEIEILLRNWDADIP
ncbi:hypothetical protein BKA56DRAFT_714323 [Ilyonectria sp. MPI-CAGE-AT-0026]|nr:hypothetical protein BKA56DRAFT_714323 [Ilyonectria sp. MPI-CAGE-AT-0026]